MKLLSGNSNKPLSKNIAKYLKSKLVNSSIRNFSDGEIYVEINENIRGNSIFLIQSISSPANDNLMELLLCIDALKRSSAKNIKFFKIKYKKLYFNLPGYVKSCLLKNKIKNIESINIDTFDINNNFFSARRALRLNHDDYGRNISIIMLN